MKYKNFTEFETVAQLIYWSYANLAMAHSALDKKQEKYGPVNFMIRAKLFKALNEGTMQMRSIFDDEKVKLETGMICNYCGAKDKLALDHIFPQRMGGRDDAENLIFACKSCNSSKGKKDLMEWASEKNIFLPLMIIRRYLKLVYQYCNENSMLDKNVAELNDMELPFNIEFIPIVFPRPSLLILNIEESKK